MTGNSRWARLAVSVLALLMAGIIYAWSFLREPIAALYEGVSSAQLQLNYTLTLCFFCVGGLISGFSAKKLSPKVRMIIGGLCVAAGFTIVSQLDGKSLFMLYLGYGALAGVGIGMVYNVVISITNAWFPDKKGIASGSMMLGFGFSAMVFGNLATVLFASSLTWRGTFLLYGLGIGACLALIGLTVRAPRPDEVTVAAGGAAAQGTDYATKDMVKRPSFALLFIFCTVLGAVGSTAIGQAKSFILGIAPDALSAAAIGASLISVMNGAGRLIAGALIDKLGLRKTQIINNIVLIAAPAVMLAALLTHSVAIGIIGLCVSGFAFSFSPTITAAFTLAFYGRKNFATNFPMLTLTLIPASFAATATSGLTLTATYTLLLVVAIVGAAVNMMIKKA